jgi:hypothetical protein
MIRPRPPTPTPPAFPIFALEQYVENSWLVALNRLGQTFIEVYLSILFVFGEGVRL